MHDSIPQILFFVGLSLVFSISFQDPVIYLQNLGIGLFVWSFINFPLRTQAKQEYVKIYNSTNLGLNHIALCTVIDFYIDIIFLLPYLFFIFLFIPIPEFYDMMYFCLFLLILSLFVYYYVSVAFIVQYEVPFLNQIIKLFERPIFFMTPIIWMESGNKMEILHEIIWLNPFYHLIRLFRDQLIFGESHLYVVLYLSFICFILYLLRNFLLCGYKS